MYTTIYVKVGDLSSQQGLIISDFHYDDELFEKPYFVGEEIDKKEYDYLKKIVDNPNVKYGQEGVVNDEGYLKYMKGIQNNKSLEAGEQA